MNRPEEGRSVKVKIVSGEEVRTYDTEEKTDAWTTWKDAKNVEESPKKTKRVMGDRLRLG